VQKVDITFMGKVGVNDEPLMPRLDSLRGPSLWLAVPNVVFSLSF